MSKHHLIITGTGRAGTTFLLQLLTELRFDTGYTPDNFEVAPYAMAGSEWDIRRRDAPYVIKSPWLCHTLDRDIEELDLRIDHAFVPIRDLYACAESRRRVVERTPREYSPGAVPGGLWMTDQPDQQESRLADAQFNLMHTLAKRDVPHTLLYFPRLTTDGHYLYGKFSRVFAGLQHDEFMHAFCKLSRPELVHDYSRQATRDGEVRQAR